MWRRQGRLLLLLLSGCGKEVACVSAVGDDPEECLLILASLAASRRVGSVDVYEPDEDMRASLALRLDSLLGLGSVGGGRDGGELGGEVEEATGSDLSKFRSFWVRREGGGGGGALW